MLDECLKTALEIFEAALGIAPHQRASWVEQACGHDARLVEEVMSLLAAHDAAGDFLDVGLTVPQSPGTAENITERVIIPGRQLGDFLIEQQIGAGGMGVVYRARQISLNRLVALKVLPPHLRSSENARTRFQREVEAAARLCHRNIVAVYTTGEEMGTAYYAMELIDGSALSQVIAELRRSPLRQVDSCVPVEPPLHRLDSSTRGRAGELTPSPDANRSTAVDLLTLFTGDGYFAAVAKLMTQVADGLAYAHQMKVVHRDVKPSNLLLANDGEIHISDFGLARLAEEPGLTRTGDFLGTPYYMAPEQISAAMGAIGERTDVYALGATLYELLTLQKSFPGENREQVISQILHNEPTPPRAINRLVPRDLDTICLKALEKEPSQRYASAGAVAEDLRRFVERRPILARRERALGRSMKWIGRHRAWSAAMAGMCALVVLAMFFAYRTHVAESRWTDAEFGRVYETAQLAAIEGDLKRASAAVGQAEQLGAPPAQLSVLRGQVALQAGKYQDACDVLEQAIQEMPDSLAAHALLTKAYDANQQHEKRLIVAKRLVSLKPSTLQDFLLLGDAQSYSDFAQAEATLDEAVGRYKTSVVARLTRGSVLIERATESAHGEHAELALDDLRIASELLEPNALILSRILEARLVAATAYAAAGDLARRQKHLDEAATTAEALTRFSDQYRSYQSRAVYFDYIGNDEQAIKAWLGMKDHSITFLVLTLYRLEKFKEALELCDERQAKYKTARFTDFLRGFILAAESDTPQKFVAAFAPRGKETLDSINAHRFTYTIDCLAGDVDAARKYSRELWDRGVHLAADEEPWRKVLAYCCGDLGEDALLAELTESRSALCHAQFLIGITHLARGDRNEARKHFRASSELKICLFVEDHMSRALIAQLDRQPNWPPWIANR